ncbi:MAG: NUDIX domain-containing protein [Alphaproteobacteria bacterium]|nr:NUDIX domain-containing protein [Alphaproteobacteria bacterium]
MSGPPRYVPPHQLPNFERRIPDGETLERLMCRDCGHIHFVNPKIVVGAVVTFEDKFLLCRRAIEPRHGFWTLPAGYLEEKEDPIAGAKREAIEEACAAISIDALLAVYAIVHASQVQLIYRARLASPEFSPGPESLDVRLFAREEIPWDDLAFPSVKWALHQHEAVRGVAVFQPFSNPTETLPDRL